MTIIDPYDVIIADKTKCPTTGTKLWRENAKFSAFEMIINKKYSLEKKAEIGREIYLDLLWNKMKIQATPKFWIKTKTEGTGQAKLRHSDKSMDYKLATDEQITKNILGYRDDQERNRKKRQRRASWSSGQTKMDQLVDLLRDMSDNELTDVQRELTNSFGRLSMIAPSSNENRLLDHPELIGVDSRWDPNRICEGNKTAKMIAMEFMESRPEVTSFSAMEITMFRNPISFGLDVNPSWNPHAICTERDESYTAKDRTEYLITNEHFSAVSAMEATMFQFFQSFPTLPVPDQWKTNRFRLAQIGEKNSVRHGKSRIKNNNFKAIGAMNSIMLDFCSEFELNVPEEWNPKARLRHGVSAQKYATEKIQKGKTLLGSVISVMLEHSEAFEVKLPDKWKPEAYLPNGYIAQDYVEDKIQKGDTSLSLSVISVMLEHSGVFDLNLQVDWYSPTTNADDELVQIHDLMKQNDISLSNAVTVVMLEPIPYEEEWKGSIGTEEHINDWSIYSGLESVLGAVGF